MLDGYIDRDDIDSKIQDLLHAKAMMVGSLYPHVIQKDIDELWRIKGLMWHEEEKYGAPVSRRY
jgi:hypothetical protein